MADLYNRRGDTARMKAALDQANVYKSTKE
jgi:hypothetical protein